MAVMIKQRHRRIPCDCPSPCGWEHREIIGEPQTIITIQAPRFPSNAEAARFVEFITERLAPWRRANE